LALSLKDGFLLDRRQLIPTGRETWEGVKVVIDAVMKRAREMQAPRRGSCLGMGMPGKMPPSPCSCVANAAADDFACAAANSATAIRHHAASCASTSCAARICASNQRLADNDRGGADSSGRHAANASGGLSEWQIIINIISFSAGKL